MRQGTAIVLVVALAVAGADAARAAQSDDAPAFRNPIEWLLSDIGKLLSGATIQKSQSSANQTETTKDTSTHSAEPNPVATTEDTEPVEAVEGSPGQAAVAPKENGFRNPLSWLFSDLARIFQPDLEIEQTAKADAVPEAPAPEKATTEAAAPATPEIAAETAVESAPVSAETAADDVHPQNPISWLFRDLARLFKPAGNVEEKTVAEASAAVSSDTEVVKPEVTVEPVKDAANIPAATEAAPLQVADLAATTATEIEVGPWVPRPAHDPFDPNGSLFDTNAQPLLPAPAPAAADPVPGTAETADTSSQAAAPDIRERPPYRPLRRNFAALGHEHKSVTPDPQNESILDRVLESLFGIEEPVETEETLANKISDRIVPEEKLDLGYNSPDATVPDQQLTRLENGPLRDIDLYMGRDSVIGAPYDKTAFKREACVERALHGSVFCLKSLNWPAEIASSFNADTAFVLPGEGLVRYENGAVSRVYSVFNASDFTEVVKFMQHRFGPPQEREVGWMHMLEAPQMPNTTFRWKAVSADRRDTIVLEVRNFDDLRRSFADMEHGMVRLYREGSRPIFKHISTMDLMLMQRRRVANAPVEVNAPPKQQ